MRLRTLATIVAALTLTLTSACSGGSDATFNDADVAFARDMIPHHEQATTMADLAPSRTDDAAVLDLASRIKAAQDPEISTMKDWLDDWDVDDSDDHGSHDMEGMGDMEMGSTPGMMSDDELAALKAASGTEFDRKFLTLMIRHHEGAVSMAETEESDGKDADAIALAKKIAAAQTSEITEMKALLAQL